MGLLAWLIVGLIAGWLAGEVMKGSGYGPLGNILVGILGALVGGFLAGPLFGIADPWTGIDVRTIVIAFVGAIVAVALIRALPGRSRL
jgi:uncharacterized membrane protein YeaQ/YmgE (transglycosylase-associated protein family)